MLVSRNIEHKIHTICSASSIVCITVGNDVTSRIEFPSVFIMNRII